MNITPNARLPHPFRCFYVYSGKNCVSSTEAKALNVKVIYTYVHECVCVWNVSFSFKQFSECIPLCKGLFCIGLKYANEVYTYTVKHKKEMQWKNYVCMRIDFSFIYLAACFYMLLFLKL